MNRLLLFGIALMGVTNAVLLVAVWLPEQEAWSAASAGFGIGVAIEFFVMRMACKARRV